MFGWKAKPVTAAQKEEVRVARGSLAEAIVDLNNKTRFLNQITQHRLEAVMGEMIELSHEGRKRDD
jgi:hypothetical protein